MRHNKSYNHLGRTSSHRKATLANMASSLVMHKKIETTVAKAKALRMYVEPLITKSKEDTTHSRRIVFSYLKDKYAVTELFRVIAPAIGERPGGYTRILKTGFRLGDAADTCFIELVDFNETYSSAAGSSAGAVKSRTRRGKAGAAKTAKAAEGTPANETIGEEGDTGASVAVAAKPVAKKAPAAGAKPAAKKPAAAVAGKPKASAPRAVKTSGSKAASTRSTASKKG